MSLDEIAQQVVNQLSQEREESSETPNDELQSGRLLCISRIISCIVFVCL